MFLSIAMVNHVLVPLLWLIMFLSIAVVDHVLVPLLWLIMFLPIAVVGNVLASWNAETYKASQGVLLSE